MLLCLDVGNTHILAGIYEKNKLLSRFRYATHLVGTADQFGIFLTSVARHYQVDPNKFKAVAIASVVPASDFTLKHAISAYLPKAKVFVLQASSKIDLKLNVKHPNEVGADRIATAMGAIDLFPKQNLMIIDMGTATTLCALTKQKEFLGGAIMPGMRLCMEALEKNTAKLTGVEIEAPPVYIGRDTTENIQSGLYFGQLGALKELIRGFKEERFKNEKVKIIGTGGFSQLYRDAKLFDTILPDLVLHGIKTAYDMHG